MSCYCVALAQSPPNPARTVSHPCGWALEFPLLSACLGGHPCPSDSLTSAASDQQLPSGGVQGT